MIPATMMVLALGGIMLFQTFDDGPVAVRPAPREQALRILIALICAGALLISSAVYWSALDGHAAQKPRFWLNGGTAQWRS
ncbi:hypothetical protein CEK62_10850 [Alcanivorax sp. N3-2A]|nr:hypothetical protein CEK62_10850 [Alcanivorax sp. N3-2A]